MNTTAAPLASTQRAHRTPPGRLLSGVGHLAGRLVGRLVRRLAGATLAALWLTVPLPAAADCPPAVEPPDTATAQRLQREAADHGLLWRVEKDGRTGWLFGTVHVGRAAWLFPGPQLASALRQAEVLALELDPLDPAVADTMARAQQRLQPAPAPRTGAGLDAQLQARLQRLAQAECLDGPGFATQPPMMQAMTLTVTAGRRIGLEPAYAQEVALSAMAHQAGKHVVSLETVDEQLAALLGDGEGPHARALLQRMVAQLEDGTAQRQIARLAQLWADSDLAQLSRFDQWCDCADSPAEQAQLQRLNDGRNPALAQRIVQLMEAGAPVLAAVGALHMTGPKALPLLLALRGYTVTLLLPARP